MGLLIKCGQLFIGNAETFIAAQSVIIDGGLITRVMDTADAERDPSLAGYEVLDASAKWVMPGLINVHDHMIFRDVFGNPPDVAKQPSTRLALNAVRNSLVALKRGWTTVRDMGATHNMALEYRDVIGAGDMPGPRVLACGSPICATGGHGYGGISVAADGISGMRRAARAQLDAGADFVKVMASHDPIVIAGPEKTRPELELDELRAAFDVAHAFGKKTACHVMGSVAIGRVLDAGIDVVSHGIYLNDDLAQRMAEQGVFLDPTLSSYGRQTLNPRLRRSAHWVEKHRPLVAPLESAFRAAVKAGVKIVTGTDSAGLYAEDVAMMRELGLSAHASLWACTSYAAEALAIGETVGTIAAGKVADIVVLDADPLADADALRKVAYVVQGGRARTPSEITIEAIL